MRRNQVSVLVGTTSTFLLGPSPKRKSVIFNPPGGTRELYTSNSKFGVNIDTSTTGVKLTYTAPAGRRAVVTYAACFLKAGTAPTIRYQTTTGGNLTVLKEAVAPYEEFATIKLAPGDSVAWNVSVAGAGSTCDLYISAEEQQSVDRYSVSFAVDAVLDQGFTLFPGGQHLMLSDSDYG